MRVKVGDTWYDESDVPICIQLTDKDLELIKGMTRETSPKLKYAVWHESAAFENTEQVKEWMNS
jgi:hypothetical protein